MRPLSIGALTLLLAACQSDAPRAPRAPERNALVVQGTEGSWLYFAADQAEERRGVDLVRTIALPARTGAPSAAAADYTGDYAVVGFESTLARIKLSEGGVSWMAPAWKSAPWAVGVKNDLAMSVSGTHASFERLDGKPGSWERDLAPWLAQHPLGALHYALPTSASEFLLVGCDDRRTTVRRVDSSSGSWTFDDTQIGTIQRLHACASDGNALYLAGVFETEQRALGGMQPGGLRQTLRVVRWSLDPAHPGVARAVVDVPRDEIETKVVQVTAGLDVDAQLLIVTLNDGTLHVFQVQKEGKAAAPIFSKRYGEPVHAAWIGRDQIAVRRSKKGDIVLEKIALGSG